jgi:phosphopentomutase
LEKQNLKAKINTSRTRKENGNANKEYQSKNKEVKKTMWNDKRKFIKQLAEKEQEAANIGNIKELYEKTSITKEVGTH